jgi:hypothetical protein
MASLTWAMVTDAQGQVAEVLHMPNRASKGKGIRLRRDTLWHQPVSAMA